jgi:alpha-L-fucosidase
MKNLDYLFLTIFIFLVSCSQTETPPSVLPVSSERQLAWHEMEFYAFVHFNMNTFTNMEWGLGSERPEFFNPTELDCRQWARVCKEAGMKGIILTAKHHDGFCLWPSKYTEHSVKNSPWKDGKGDVVRELSEACKEYGLKMGIYLSPWDRNSADYGKPEYITYFRNQLRELLTNYGDIFEVWFDGANGGTGYYGGANEERRIDHTTYYDWENTRKIVRELQPMACMFSDGGPDIRWVGNEQGWASKSNWCTLNRNEFAPGVVSDIKFLQKGQENGSDWVPAEVDVSIRPGWYYHPSEDHKVKSLPQLLDIYYHSVGRNASLLLNLPVDKRGLVNENDVRQLNKLSDAIKTDFANDLAIDKKVTATNSRGNSRKYQSGNVNDNNPDTYWATDDNVKEASITIDFGKPSEFNRFLVQEDIRLGQRVKQFTLEALVGDEWNELANETTIGRKRILRFANVTASKLRLNIVDSKACPVISNIGVYKAPKVLVEPEVRRDKSGMVSVKAFDTGLYIHYTINNGKSSVQSEKYTEPFALNKKATVKVIAVDPETGKESPATSVDFDVPHNKWVLLGATAKEKGAENMIDGNPNSSLSISQKLPVDFLIDLGEPLNLKGFTYLPDQRRGNPGIIFNYAFYVSMDGKSWGDPISKGEFSNIKNSPVLQEKEFSSIRGRFIKLRALSTIEENGRVGVAELEIITQ